MKDGKRIDPKDVWRRGIITDKQVEAALMAYQHKAGHDARWQHMKAALEAAERAAWQSWGTEDMHADALFLFDNGWIGIMEGHDAENYARQKTGPKPTHWQPLPEPPDA